LPASRAELREQLLRLLREDEEFRYCSRHSRLPRRTEEAWGARPEIQRDPEWDTAAKGGAGEAEGGLQPGG